MTEKKLGGRMVRGKLNDALTLWLDITVGNALRRVSEESGIPVVQLIRLAINRGMPFIAPEFMDYVKQNQEKELELLAQERIDFSKVLGKRNTGKRGQSDDGTESGSAGDLPAV